MTYAIGVVYQKLDEEETIWETPSSVPAEQERQATSLNGEQRDEITNA